MEDQIGGQAKKDDDLEIDFSGITNKVKSFFKSSEEDKAAGEHAGHHPEHHHKDSSEEISLDFSQIAGFAKKHARWLIPVALILIAMFCSIYLRTMPLRMPLTDEWAQNTVYNFYKSNLGNQISQQYPNLPQANQEAMIQKEWQKFLSQNKDRIKSDIAQVSGQYKNQFKDDNGTLYLLGIDPYHYYRVTGNILQYGHQGTAIKDGVPWDYYFMAPEGRWAGKDFHAYFGAFLHRLMNFFGNFPLMFTFFLIGTIFSALSVIPAFFIGRRITGNNAGAFFTAMLVAVSAFFVSRTTGESSDTDVYVVFFPLLITWLFLEAFEAKELKKKLVWISLAGISTGIFTIAWVGGWWYVFDFILGTIGIYLVYLLARNYKNIKETIRSKLFRHSAYILITYFATTTIVAGLVDNMLDTYYGLLGPFLFLQLKAVAVDSLWPNILTTVAELNVVPLSSVINQLGGRMLFALAIAGVLLTFLKKDEEKHPDVKVPIFLTIWFIASLYATTKGVRFTLQATPVFAIAFGSFLGMAWHYASQWTSKNLKINLKATQIVLFIILALLLIQPIQAGYAQAYQSVPSMNDGWYNALKKIDSLGDKKAIVNSWWDFGHWFKAIANRPVTFDGAAQTSYGAHWVGKALLTNDEKHTVGILRMLNCGQNNAFDELDKTLNDTHKSVKILDEIITKDKTEAIKILKDNGLNTEQTASVVKYTHCDAPRDYFITSDDMIGKAGVWGHFGSWNFERAEMYQKSLGLGRGEAVKLLVSEYKLTEDQAGQTYDQIQSTPADQWIASWPGYASGLSSCNQESKTKFSCSVGTQQGTIIFDLDASSLASPKAAVRNNANQELFPASLVYATKNGVEEKTYSENTIPYSVILVPQGENGFAVMMADPRTAYSTFSKLFFFEGHGMKCFNKFDEVRPFTGGKISTWKVDYDCQQENKVFFLPKEEVRAAHILISTVNGRSDDDAKKLIDEIKKNLTSGNFGDYAKQYSEDPGSKNNGGELGWFGKGVMVPEFENAAFSLKPGEISEPFKSQFGWHVILVEEKRIK